MRQWIRLQPLRWVMFSILVLGLSGCGDQRSKQRSLKAYIASVKQRPAGSIEPMPKPVIQKQFVYSANTLRSPFEMPTLDEGEQPDKDRPKEALEHFPLDALRLVGVIERGKVHWALVQAPNGVVYRVRSGNYIGQNYGQIKTVSKVAMVVVEKVRHAQGEWKQREAEIKMHASETQ